MFDMYLLIIIHILWNLKKNRNIFHCKYKTNNTIYYYLYINYIYNELIYDYNGIIYICNLLKLLSYYFINLRHMLNLFNLEPTKVINKFILLIHYVLIYRVSIIYMFWSDYKYFCSKISVLDLKLFSDIHINFLNPNISVSAILISNSHRKEKKL